MDAISEQRLTEIHPYLAEAIRQMADRLASEGIVLKVTQGFRSYQEQDALYAQGRTAPGPIITNARAGYSWHAYGLACDCLPQFESQQPADWNPQHPQWQRMEELGVGVGLVAGGAWRSFPDYPHFQLRGIPVTPTDEDRQAFFEGGIPAVWARNGLALPPMMVSDPDLGI